MTEVLLMPTLTRPTGYYEPVKQGVGRGYGYGSGETLPPRRIRDPLARRNKLREITPTHRAFPANQRGAYVKPSRNPTPAPKPSAKGRAPVRFSTGAGTSQGGFMKVFMPGPGLGGKAETSTPRMSFYEYTFNRMHCPGFRKPEP